MGNSNQLIHHSGPLCLRNQFGALGGGHDNLDH